MFILNDAYLISYLIINGRSDRQVNRKDTEILNLIVNFQDKAWELNETMYYTLEGRSGMAGLVPTLPGYKFSEVGSMLDDYISNLCDTEEYKILKKQTEDSIAVCKAEWDRNYKQTSEYIESLGIKVDEDYKIWMSHPALRTGRNIGNKNILWADRHDWPNYNTVYIWHEMLHSFFKKGQVEHAVIELITDNHMRFLLNGTSYPPFEGHDDLKPLKEKLLKNWTDFIKSDRKDIKEWLQNLPEFSI